MEKTNGELKIESGIPIPTTGKRGRNSGVLKAMQVGDSVLFPDTNMNRVTHKALYAFGKGGYTCRTVEGGIRVWRTK